MGDATREPLEVRVLGPFGVSRDGLPIDLTSGRLRVLLAVLAMSAGRPVSVERLTDAVWDDDPPASGRRTLQTYITRLRNALGAESIATESAGYVLHTVPENVDALRFLRLVDRASTEPDLERTLLSEALGLWRGSPFEGLDSRWLRESEAARLQERWLAATERRVDLDLTDGRADEWVSMLRELALRHPMREPLWTRLLVALARSGRQSEALEQYEAVRARIADELGVDPGAELQRIYADLLVGADPEPSGATERPTSTIPRQLPVDIGSFVGRDQAMAALDELASDAAGRLIMMAVHGTGGVGKTSLVVHWAHRVAEHFPDGQLYVNLRGYGPGAPMTSAVALDILLRGLGVADERIPTEVEARENLLRSMLAERQALLILDNARDSEQVRPLLPGSGRTAVVMTSRSQLRGLVAREGVHRVGLDQLEPSESEALLAGALAARGVRHDAATLGELAQRCGHLPLALSVAAERAGRQPDAGVFELIDELRVEQERLDALDVGDESTDVRAVFAWSYHALDADTARMFRLLGMHPGPDLSRPAAAALADITNAQARRLLDRLVDGSLLQQRRYGRYELHDLLRAYAAELAERHDSPEDKAAALDRLFGWYVGSATQANRTILPVRPIVPLTDSDRVVAALTFDGQQQAVAWLDGERQVLVAVVHESVRRSRHRATYLLVFALANDFARRRNLVELAELLQLARGAAEEAADPFAMAQTAKLFGLTFTQLLDDDRACVHFEAARKGFAAAGNERGEAQTLVGLGAAHETFGRPAAAIGCYERALTFQRRLGDPQDESVTLNNLAMAYIDVDRFDDAIEASQRALAIARRHGPASDVATFLDTLGRSYLAQDRHAEAVDAFEAAVERARLNQDRWEEGVMLTSLGRALRAADRPEAAHAAWRQALDTFDEIGASDAPDFNRSELVELIASGTPTRTDPA